MSNVGGAGPSVATRRGAGGGTDADASREELTPRRGDSGLETADGSVLLRERPLRVRNSADRKREVCTPASRHEEFPAKLSATTPAMLGGSHEVLGKSAAAMMNPRIPLRTCARPACGEGGPPDRFVADKEPGDSDILRTQQDPERRLHQPGRVHLGDDPDPEADGPIDLIPVKQDPAEREQGQEGIVTLMFRGRGATGDHPEQVVEPDEEENPSRGRAGICRIVPARSRVRPRHRGCRGSSPRRNSQNPPRVTGYRAHCRASGMICRISSAGQDAHHHNRVIWRWLRSRGIVAVTVSPREIPRKVFVHQ